MPAPATVADLIALVKKSGLVDPADVDACFADPDRVPDGPTRAAALLIKAGKLTQFQAKQLLAGKYRGLVLGQYRLLDHIGKGGMGSVFLAEHPGMGRKVAVKVLPEEMAENKAALERFRREARAAAALDHPNIVRAYDVGQAHGVNFLVMEYVDGRTLEEEMAGGPIPYRRAVGYVAQAAEGLYHAHDMGFVHRDIKPANLMVDRRGTVKILDMGLTRSFEKASDKVTELLDQNAVVGTADYIAPEQALNQKQDARTDVYSLGATLYALVAGRPPFDGSATQKLLKHQLNEAPPLTEVAPGVPDGLAATVARMMAKKPENRFPSMAEVLDALAPWMPDAPATAASTTRLRSDTTRVQPSQTAPPPRWLIPAAIAAGVVVLLAVLIWALV